MPGFNGVTWLLCCHRILMLPLMPRCQWGLIFPLVFWLCQWFYHLYFKLQLRFNVATEKFFSFLFLLTGCAVLICHNFSILPPGFYADIWIFCWPYCSMLSLRWALRILLQGFYSTVQCCRHSCALSSIFYSCRNRSSTATVRLYADMVIGSFSH